MKKLASALWVMAAIIMIVGAFFKIMHYSGSAGIMMIAYLIAAVGFVMAFMTRKKTKAS